jgi:DNA-binding transcriptional MerR regulator
MQMSELSAQSQVPVATVKFYLREGLLPPGVATSATRATYDASHVRRLKLIRALAEVGGLRLEQIRGVLAAVDDPESSLHDALGSALMPLADGSDVDADARRRVDRMVRRWRWRVAPDSNTRDALAHALAVLDSLEHPMSDEMLDRYADAMHTIAEAEVATLPADRREEAIQSAVIGTLLVEPVLSAIRRMAQEEVSKRRFGRPTRTARRSRG